MHVLRPGPWIVGIALLMAVAAPVAQQKPVGWRQKVDSQLLQVIAKDTKPAKDTKGRPRVDDKQRVLVDVRIEVAPATRALITELGSDIVSTSAEYRSVIAWVPLDKIETLANDERVQFIQPAPEPARRQHR